jgi:predicted enzyme related to lactoylglutathione lyase
MQTTSQDAANIRGMDLVGVTARDGAAVIAFYRDVLGLKPTLEAPSGTAAEFELADGSTFGVWQPEGDEAPPGLGVLFSVPDLDAAIARARERGAKLGDVMEFPACRMAGGADPEGNHFVLHQRKAT